MVGRVTEDTTDTIVRAKLGSPEAAGELYSVYHQSIYRYLYYRTDDSKTAEDLTAEVFLRMVEYLPSYRIEKTPIQAWLFQIAHNLLIDHYRKNKSHRVMEFNENLDVDGFDLDHTIDFHLTASEMSRALSRLDENQRNVLIFRFIEGKSIAEVARSLQKSEDAIKAIQRRGLIALRALVTS